MVMRDLNIDTQKNEADANHYLSDLCDTFSLANLISSSTYFKSLSRTSIDVFLTNRTRTFHKTAITETGISDHHKLTISFLDCILNEFHSKKSNMGIIRNLMQQMF